MEDIPCEEVNRGKNGIKIKTLFDAGYKTLLDLDRADADTLAAINGIITRGAMQIGLIVNDIKEKAVKSIKIDLSGEKTENLRSLIKSLYTYMETAPCADKIYDLVFPT